MYDSYENGDFFITDLDWGDGTIEYASEPIQLGNTVSLNHSYIDAGIYEVTGYMLRVKQSKEGNVIGVLHNKRFAVRININEDLDNEFEYLGGEGFTFIPYKETTPIIGGISKNSIYYKSIKRQLGILDDDIVNVEFKNSGDKLKTEVALVQMDEEFKNLFLIHSFSDTINDGTNDIYTGITDNFEELGGSIGDTDIGQVRYFDEPLQMYELLGFGDISYRFGEELIVGQGNRDFETANDWYDGNLVDGGGAFNTSGDLSITSANADNYCILTVINAPMTVGKSYRLTFDVANIDSQWYIRNFANNQTFGTIDTNGANSFEFTCTSGTGGFWIVSSWDVGSVDLDNFSLTQLISETADYETMLEAQLYHPGNPDSPRYWNNIIPEDYTILDRSGVVISGDDITITETDPQTWTGTNEYSIGYYYPVLPKLNAFGKFDESLGLQGPGNTPFGDRQFWDEDDIYAYITNSEIEDDSLLIDIESKEIESKEIERNIFNDRSGNDFVGMGISDYKVRFDTETVKPTKNKFISRINLGKTKDGAF